jgi:hypothetical protein
MGRYGVSVCAVVVLMGMMPHPAAASDQPGATPASGVVRWSFDVTGAAYHEAWDYNGSDEDLYGVDAGILRRISRHWSVGAAGHVLGVNQDTVPNAVVSGTSLVIRWQRSHERLSLFVDGEGGASYATSIVPARGTRFNYIAILSVGIVRPLTSRTTLLASGAWLHLSNNSLAGPSRNPDIEALGIRVGIERTIGSH